MSSLPPPASQASHSTQRRIITVLPGPFDTVWLDAEKGELWIQTVLCLAATKVFEVERDRSGQVVREECVGDQVVPVDANDLFGDGLDLVDNQYFIGTIPHGADPYDRSFLLELPREIRREAS